MNCYFYSHGINTLTYSHISAPVPVFPLNLSLYLSVLCCIRRRVSLYLSALCCIRRRASPVSFILSHSVLFTVSNTSVATTVTEWASDPVCLCVGLLDPDPAHVRRTRSDGWGRTNRSA